VSENYDADLLITTKLCMWSIFLKITQKGTEIMHITLFIFTSINIKK